MQFKVKKKKDNHLLANCTKFMPQRILQIHPTIMINVTICKKAAKIFRRKAFIRFSIFVGHPQKTVKADIKVPVKIERTLCDFCFSVSVFVFVCRCIYVDFAWLHWTSAAVIWLKYCRYGVKHYPINQSINGLRIILKNKYISEN